MEQKTKKTTNFLKNIGNGKSLPEIERENDEIDEYLKFSCKHYRMTKFSPKPEGEEVSASTVENLNN